MKIKQENERHTVMNLVRVPKLQTESSVDYIYRVCSAKKANKWTWRNVRDIINRELGQDYSESYYRKKFKDHSIPVVNVPSNTGKETNLSSLEKTLLQIREERLKLSDERIQNNAYIRRLDREKTLIEIAEIASRNLGGKRLLPEASFLSERTGSKKAILQLSDWHYGIDIDNPWNLYNTEIAKERLLQLKLSVIHKCKCNDVNEIYVVNLGDLISGRIHETIRIQNRIDVITQVLEVSELLAEFLSDLVTQSFKVKYISCSDNHSRLEPKKELSLDLESLTRVTDKFLRLSLKDTVEFIESPYGHDIATFKVFDYNIVAVHGHKDTPKNIVSNMSLTTHQYYNLALTAHLHHFSADETNETVIVSNGSLMGVDEYAQQLRLTSKPSQNLIICSEESVVDSIHRIVVD